MTFGITYADDSLDRAVSSKITRAAILWKEKTGLSANCVVVNDLLDIDGLAEQVPGIEIKRSRYIRPDHFFIGVTDDSLRAAQASTQSKG